MKRSTFLKSILAFPAACKVALKEKAQSRYQQIVEEGRKVKRKFIKTQYKGPYTQDGYTVDMHIFTEEIDGEIHQTIEMYKEFDMQLHPDN